MPRAITWDENAAGDHVTLSLYFGSWMTVTVMVIIKLDRKRARPTLTELGLEIDRYNVH
jgi:hypothetical protein